MTAAPDERGVEQCHEAIARTRERLARRGPIAVGLVRQSIGDAVPRSVFDACLLQLEAEGAAVLTPHARPEALDALRLRGSAWVLESVGTTRLVARLDMSDRGAGTHDVAVEPRALNLPSGLTLEGLSPGRVRVDLTPSSPGSRPGKEREPPAP